MVPSTASGPALRKCSCKQGPRDFSSTHTIIHDCYDFEASDCTTHIKTNAAMAQAIERSGEGRPSRNKLFVAQLGSARLN